MIDLDTVMRKNQLKLNFPTTTGICWDGSWRQAAIKYYLEAVSDFNSSCLIQANKIPEIAAKMKNDIEEAKRWEVKMKTDKSEKERQELHEKILQVEQKRRWIMLLKRQWEFSGNFAADFQYLTTQMENLLL